MTWTRRKLLKTGLGLALAGSMPFSASCGTDTAGTLAPLPVPVPPPPEFPQPPVLASSGGLLEATLNVDFAQHTVSGQTFTHRSFNGLLGGPTLRVRPGDTLRLRVNNNLPPEADDMVMPADENIPHGNNTTNIHTHGLHVSPQGNSDNIFVSIGPGQSFDYEYQIPANHPAGTYWYHTHHHGSTSVQLFSAMAGPLIIEGDIDQVPAVALARDIVAIVHELNIGPDGQVPAFMGPASFPLTQRFLTVNGEILPRLVVNPGEVVRLRVINATVRTELPLFLDGHELNVISYDGIALPATRPDQISLPAAGRADVMFRAGAPGIYSLRKGVGNAGINPDPEIVLATVEVAGSPVTMNLPFDLPAPFLPIADDELTGQRELVFAVGPGGPAPGFPNFTIDGVRFDPDVVNQTVQLGAVEQWVLTNTSNVTHPFHIHINDFQVMSVNGVAPPVPEWRDTVDIPPNGQVIIRSRFLDFTGVYVLHCHILTHEDTGMMQIVQVVEP